LNIINSCNSYYFASNKRFTVVTLTNSFSDDKTSPDLFSNGANPSFLFEI